mmetsp:Transcript_96147/g.170640  ORF Transcript_96147/g.170640 Transcript_96147/m.170640 type:complete len:473 (+) Transcript_96147:58-1476(+)|eukprot:CAMPEP_0197626162 /NCGR_PEP_ID=MMETSP1338-20131121/5255_1 /TAXON_ID=43686 ORGANISM="Pelagodinium beii, Strain RCC1491" /NCGR_SAMPLE_ID=MMETSP1338 /ASSEMBLY_ACC=CAM_ASM_000754 /LENGTH=472 /DNA_ID=CAMNT_0043196681 /DNA_START=58 /DNA_END=1476 /DNA_ORIENTATION=-
MVHSDAILPSVTSEKSLCVLCPVLAVVVALKMLAGGSRAEKCKAGMHQNSPSLASDILHTSSASLAFAVDSAAAAVALPLFVDPDERGGVIFYFLRPAIGFTAAAVLLPPLLHRTRPKSSLQCTAAGLALLSMSCLPQAMELCSAVTALRISRYVGAIASALLQVSSLHSLVMHGGPSGVGWRLNGALYGLVFGSSCGVWVIRVVSSYLGCTGTSLRAVAMLAMLSCCLHFALSSTALALSASPRGEDRKDGQLVRSASESWTWQQLVLLAGIGMTAAILSLRTGLLPVFVSSFRWHAEGLPQLPTGLSAVLTGAAVLLAGVLPRCIGDNWLHAALALNAALPAWGLRAIVNGCFGARAMEVSCGYMAVCIGLGGYLGISVPLLARMSMRAGPPSSPVAMDISLAIVSSLFLGDGLGVAFQITLLPMIGAGRTLLGFAACLALLASAVLMSLPWMEPNVRGLEAKVMKPMMC